MIEVRKSDSRGVADFGWLKSKHTFSFGSWYDPRFMGISVLRVINEDRIDVGSGFDTHGHQNMEIISYVKSGSLAHKDSMGNVETIPAGDVQRMSAGTGVLHSEFNAANSETHFFQIWILPKANNISPSYEQRSLSQMKSLNHLTLLVSPDGRDNSLSMNQDASLYRVTVSVSLTAIPLDRSRCQFFQVIEGSCMIQDCELMEGDMLYVEDESQLAISGVEGELLYFDLPRHGAE